MRKLALVALAVASLVGTSTYAADREITVPTKNLQGPVTVKMSSPCDLEQISAADIDPQTWMDYKKSLYQSCQTVDLPPTVDTNSLVVATQIATMTVPDDGSVQTSMTVYRIHAPVNRSQSVTIPLDHLGIGAPFISGGKAFADADVFTIPANKTGYLTLYTTDGGDEWSGDWSVK